MLGFFSLYNQKTSAELASFLLALILDVLRCGYLINPTAVQWCNAVHRMIKLVSCPGFFERGHAVEVGSL